MGDGTKEEGLRTLIQGVDLLASATRAGRTPSSSFRQLDSLLSLVVGCPVLENSTYFCGTRMEYSARVYPSIVIT